MKATHTWTPRCQSCDIGRSQRPLRALCDNSPSDTAPGALFTVAAQDLAELGFLELIYQRRCRARDALIHPHVERTVGGEAEAALSRAELPCRDAEIDERARTPSPLAKRANWLPRESQEEILGDLLEKAIERIESGEDADRVLREARRSLLWTAVRLIPGRVLRYVRSFFPTGS